ncbi:hypothetical protein OPT61_g3172 [Boeremia exigua]|uniref:Uncharacterized protein n=1 Tax=Boeremia exigua TaxID=749465 RepID=A0ACC2IIS4_9PLEO|nr:hypothetical protein OPT61_g3172 [Boeremia exigua]
MPSRSRNYSRATAIDEFVRFRGSYKCALWLCAESLLRASQNRTLYLCPTKTLPTKSSLNSSIPETRPLPPQDYRKARLSVMPINNAAWIPADKQSLIVGEAPYPTPGPKEIVLRNRAIAINPIDWIQQSQGTAFGFRWIKFPFILGNDVAGEVVEIGNQVKRFKVGDRVLGQAMATDQKINNAAYGAFQLYTVILEQVACPIPDHMSFEVASVLPLGFTTAAAGLFGEDQLGLQYPQLEPEKKEKTVLIWGGSTSVGCNAIQLATAAGYDVITTCSPKNFDLVKSLGAIAAFDYRDPCVNNDIVRAMAGKSLAGAISIGQDSMFHCLDILARCEGDKRLAMATFPVPDPSQPRRFAALQILLYAAISMISITVKARLGGIKIGFIWGSVVDSPVGDAVYRDFLPKALANNSFTAMPEPKVIGDGLEMVQEAMYIQKQGVSAKKVVVRLNEK